MTYGKVYRIVFKSGKHRWSFIFVKDNVKDAIHAAIDRINLLGYHAKTYSIKCEVIG